MDPTGGRDPQPFGYQFDGNSPTPANGHDILSEGEGAQLNDFFANNGPDHSDAAGLGFSFDATDFSVFPPPRVLSTSLLGSNQHFQNGHQDTTIPGAYLGDHSFGDATDDMQGLQAATTLLSAREQYVKGTSYSVPSVPSSHHLPMSRPGVTGLPTNGVNMHDLHNFDPMGVWNMPGMHGTNGVNGFHGPNGTNGVNGNPVTHGTHDMRGMNGMNGTNRIDGIHGSHSTHSINGFAMHSPTGNGFMQHHMANIPPRTQASPVIPVDARVAPHFGHMHQQHQQQQPLGGPVQLDPRRSYVYGTDDAFNGKGYAAPPNAREKVEDRLMETLAFAQGPMIDRKTTASVESRSSNPSETVSPEAPSQSQPKKRRRTQTSVKAENARRKSSSAQPQTKRARGSVDETARRKRSSLAEPKPPRQNLTDEQKRSNHIFSEQKRRNLIKDGHADLNDLVPEVHNAGLSRSNALAVTAIYLEKLLADNKALEDLLRKPAKDSKMAL